MFYTSGADIDSSVLLYSGVSQRIVECTMSVVGISRTLDQPL